MEGLGGRRMQCLVDEAGDDRAGDAEDRAHDEGHVDRAWIKEARQNADDEADHDHADNAHALSLLIFIPGAGDWQGRYAVAMLCFVGISRQGAALRAANPFPTGVASCSPASTPRPASPAPPSPSSPPARAR